MFEYFIFLNVFIFTTFSHQVKYSCRDEFNKPVDWYVIYKLPRIEDHENHLVRQGKAYAYITSKENHEWILSKKPITLSESIPGLTLDPIYKKETQRRLFYMLYNDETPRNTYIGGGHAKGVVVGGETGGFWLIHSVPHYSGDPSKSHHYSYPHRGLRYGQSFMCITLDRNNLELAGQGLWYSDLHVYAKNVPGILKIKYPNLARVAEGQHVKSAPWNCTVDIVSAGGKRLHVFAKSEEFHKELYSGWVAPNLKVNLSVQTWPNGESHLQSYCTPRLRVENIEEISVSDVEFHTTKDHSKWAASEEKSEPWVCVGDINRDLSQERRGGGTVCMKDEHLWKAYYSSIVKLNRC